MDKNLTVVLILDTLTIAIGWLIYLGNIPSNTSLFLFASQTILVLGLISLGITFAYLFVIGGVNKYIYPSIIILIIGVIITFFNWFVGGIIVLFSLICLILSRQRGRYSYLSIVLIFVGFIVLTLLPPIQAMMNTKTSMMDYFIIMVSIVIIVIGVSLSFKKRAYLDTYLGYIALSISFFLLPPYHEIFKIKSNGAYGIYDSAIIIIATILYFVFFGGIIYASYKKGSIIKRIKEGNKYLESGNWKKAYRTFEKIYKHGYADDNVFNGMGVALMHMGKFNESEKYIKKAIKIRDGDEYRTNLGNIYYRRGEIKKAMAIYEKVLEKNPNCYLALNNIARCLMKKGKITEAEEYLKRAMEVNPKGKVARKNYALLNTKYKNESEKESIPL